MLKRRQVRDLDRRMRSSNELIVRLSELNQLWFDSGDKRKRLVHVSVKTSKSWSVQTNGFYSKVQMPDAFFNKGLNVLAKVVVHAVEFVDTFVVLGSHVAQNHRVAQHCGFKVHTHLPQKVGCEQTCTDVQLLGVCLIEVTPVRADDVSGEVSQVAFDALPNLMIVGMGFTGLQNVIDSNAVVDVPFLKGCYEIVKFLVGNAKSRRRGIQSNCNIDTGEFLIGWRVHDLRTPLRSVVDG